MSHLGSHILYDVINRDEDVFCERVYAPNVDMEEIMREKNIPLFALEDTMMEIKFLVFSTSVRTTESHGLMRRMVFIEI